MGGRSIPAGGVGGEDDIGRLYSEFNLNYEQVFTSSVRDILIKAASEYEAADLWKKRGHFGNIMQDGHTCGGGGLGEVRRGGWRRRRKRESPNSELKARRVSNLDEDTCRRHHLPSQCWSLHRVWVGVVLKEWAALIRRAPICLCSRGVV